jgi:CDP-glucose 4,6-dehydratase
MTEFGDIYRGKQILLTGHTGFKGSWLALWLHELGAKITGIALSPESSYNHWDLLRLPCDDIKLDIRDRLEFTEAFVQCKPEVVFHLAAQPLVRQSYLSPVETWSTNVMGTAHVLEACRHTPSVRAVVCVTTDKCYENQEWVWGYRENDRLGGHDPYSASKAGAELVASSYRRSYFSDPAAPYIATARAGNVIGGGDWSEDRLIPDLVRALRQDKSLEVRKPEATRPWQHVLESLSGYLCLGQALLSGDRAAAEAWNFGPDAGGNAKVSDVLTRFETHWERLKWFCPEQHQPHETALLNLDSTKARTQLHWEPVWSLDEAIQHTAHWYRAWLDQGQVISGTQLKRYREDARSAGLKWALG